MARHLVLISALILLPLWLSAQNKASTKKAPTPQEFITLPMFTKATPVSTMEKALKNAMGVFITANKVAAVSIVISACKITATENLKNLDRDMQPQNRPDGTVNPSYTTSTGYKYCEVTWDVEFTVTKDVDVNYLWLDNSLINWRLLGYFHDNMETVFKDKVEKAIYRDHSTLILKAGEKFRLVGIHSRMLGPAINSTWTCYLLRDLDHHVKSITPTLKLIKATTLDAKSVSADYEIKDAAAPSIHFDVYRSHLPEIADLNSIIENDNLVKLGETNITDPDQLTPTKHNNVDLLLGIDLPPDTRMPYIIAVATFNNKKQQIYFKKWMLGAVSHGFDRLAMNDPLLISTDDPLLLISEGWVYRVTNMIKMYFSSKVSHVFSLFWREFTLPEWEITMVNQLQEKDGYDHVFQFDWMKTCALPDHEYAVDAGFKLADMITAYMVDNSKHPGDVVDLHLIGHSRGTVIVTQALKVLNGKLKTDNSPFGGSYVELTLLDPHPANNTLEPRDPSKPSGTSWASWGRDVEGYADCSLATKIEISPDCLSEVNKINSYKELSSITDDEQKQLLDGLNKFDAANSCIKSNKQLLWSLKNFLSLIANYLTIKFQDVVKDNPLEIPQGLKKIDIYYQHTLAKKLCDQNNQEFIQNLWGMVSPTTIIWTDPTVTLESHNLTDYELEGIGVVGHNEVPLVYEQLWVDSGTLNRSTEISNKNLKP